MFLNHYYVQYKLLLKICFVIHDKYCYSKYILLFYLGICVETSLFFHFIYNTSFLTFKVIEYEMEVVVLCWETAS